MYKAKINLQTFPSEGIVIDKNIKITSCIHGHPSGANTYRLEIGKTKIVYCTDIEHPENNLTPNIIKIAKDANLLIKDPQFRDHELSSDKVWGHSSWQQCTKIAKLANVKNYFYFTIVQIIMIILY